MFIPKLFKENNIFPKGVIHVGASFCQEEKQYESLGLTHDKVIWIEANPEVVDKVKKHNKRVMIYNRVFSNTREELDFIVTNHSQSSSILELKEHKKEYPKTHEVKRLKLKSITLDDFIEQEGITIDIDFLNMDVQGAELKVLKGASKTIEKLKYIYAEVSRTELYEGCCLVGDIHKFLEKKGFVMRELKWEKGHTWGNAFFSRK